MAYVRNYLYHKEYLYDLFWSRTTPRMTPALQWTSLHVAVAKTVLHSQKMNLRYILPS